MKNTNDTAPTIVSIDWSDRDCSTDVVDIIHLSDGRTIQAWNGQASYCAYDNAKGRVEVGASLVSEEGDETYSGDPFRVFTFA